MNRGRYVRAALRRAIEAEDLEAWLRKERVYHGLHVRAMRNREAARERVDAAVARYGGTILSWQGISDASTTEDCREMFGKNFDATRPPARGLPGTVHGFCRCFPGPEIPGAEVVY